MSGSAVVEMRRRALATSGTVILIVDSAMRIRMASGNAAADLAAGPLVGVSLTEVLGAVSDGSRLEQAVRRAQVGTESELSLQIAEGSRSVRCVPLAGDIGSTGPVAMVAIADDLPVSSQLIELRARADDSETLSGAVRALARSNTPEETSRTVCAAAADVAGADFAALIEMRPDRSGLVVVAASGADLEGRSASIDRAAHAARAFTTGQAEFTSGGGAGLTASAWPLGQVGAQSTSWHPVQRTIGIRGVVAVGWCRRTSPPSEQTLAAMQMICGEAAVAIDRAAALERLTGMARTDPLTELFNRRAWQEELSRELARAERSGQRLAIGLLDLDQLKSYNDRWGHAAGDRVLLTAAARWRRRLRLTDLLARIGGDEFAVTMPGCGLVEAIEIGDQLRAALPDGLSCSVGVAAWSGGESAADLLARADEALYAAKNSGRDATFSLPTPAGPRSGGSVPSS